MNAALRKVSLAALLLLLALLLNANVLQSVQAKDLRTKDGNTRALLESYKTKRGPIVVRNSAIARSEPSDDVQRFLRVYPGGEMYAAVTGYATLYSRGGLELAEDSILSGKDDRLFVHRLTEVFSGREREGGVVRLTIDPDIQKAAWEALRGRKGAAVALNPKTGEILALVSTPSYDPAKLAVHDTGRVTATMEALEKDADKPLLNRALAQTYPPGSTFKVITSAAALSGGMTAESVVDAPHRLKLPQTTIELRNYADEVCDPSGKQTLLEALEMSCNTAFAQLGIDMGADTLRAQAEKFGLNDDNLAVPTATATSVFPSDLNKPQTAQSAIGQFDVRITPLQAAMIAAAVANNGTLMQPYLVDRIEGPDLKLLEKREPKELGQAVTPEVAGELTRMMTAVVESGTAKAARIPGVTVAGKTGTAQHAKGASPHAWFIAFTPGADPGVAVAVLIESGGSNGGDVTGGRVAAPIARAMIEAAQK